VETEVLSGYELKKMLNSGLAYLAVRYKDVDLLNVFPVPDGDTGTNMYLTLTSAVQEVGKAGNLSSIGGVAEAASRGALMGARGNSGVILSQLLRGMARCLKNMDRVSAKVFAQALDEGVKVAVKAVIRPVEGTILTVARESAKEALKASGKNLSIVEMLKKTCQAAEKTLNRTPEMLSALREAGVVDAGGMGWLIILQGFRAGLEDGRTPGFAQAEPGKPPDIKLEKVKHVLKYPYCTEILIKTDNADTGKLQEGLQKLGDSLLVVGTEGFARIHIHSAHPGTVLEECLKHGSLTQVKVTNMNEQTSQAEAGKDREPALKPYGIVSVAIGEGIKKIMESLGADKVITGGQTMNPSAGEMLQAIEDVKAETVIILPNNSNILMAANQVAELSDMQVKVVPSRTVPQGLAALLAVTPGASTEKIVENMTESVKNVKTGEITYAVRDTQVDGQKVQKGAIIGLHDNQIVNWGSEVGNVVLGLLEKMAAPDDEVCTLYHGEMVTGEEARSLLGILEEKFANLEFELHYGGQPLYYYIISVE